MIRAIIFDLDGTLVDTEPMHFAAFNQALAPLGIMISRQEYYGRLIGYDDRGCFETVLRECRRRAPKAGEIEELTRRKSAFYMELIAAGELLYPGAREFVRRCAARFPLGLATGTLRDEAEVILSRTGLRESFIAVVAAEDASAGKPSPEPFIAVLARLNAAIRGRSPHARDARGEHGPQSTGEPAISARQCLVMEDSVAGVAAARAAEMKVLALTYTASRNELADAHMVFEAFDAIDLEHVLRSFVGEVGV